MASIKASIRHHVVNLARFAGRDTPGQFWPWALLVYLVLTCISLVITFAAVARGFIAFFQGLQSSPGAGPGPGPEDIEKMMSGMMEGIADIWLPLTIINGLMIILLAAGVSRRLHDRGRTAFWGLLPLPFWIAGAVFARRAMELAMVPGGAAGRSPADTLVMLIGPLSWVALIVLVVMLIGEGEAGPNRYGPDPRAAA